MKKGDLREQIPFGGIEVTRFSVGMKNLVEPSGVRNPHIPDW